MAIIRDVNSIVQKWVRVAPGRTEDYKAGVTNPKKDWHTETVAAAERWQNGIQQAIADKSYERGVAATPTAKWQAKASGVGTARWQQGIGMASDNYAAGMTKVVDTIAKVKLPPRYPKGDPRNIERVVAITTALRAMKLGKK